MTRHSALNFLRSRLPALAVAVSIGALGAMLQAGAQQGPVGGLWTSAGQNRNNTSNAATEDTITPANAGNLVVKWVFNAAGDVSATPSVDESNVYFPDWGGLLHSLDRTTGAENWSVAIGDYNGLDAASPSGPGGGTSRTTPAIYGSSLILGDQGGRSFGGASVMSVDKNTGALNWITKIESHPAAMVTQSPVVVGNVVYVGVASNDEGFAIFVPGYQCCSFRGSVVALDANTGTVLWKTYTTPDNPGFPTVSGYSGVGVWGSTPVVDVKRGSVYVATGNNYSAPDDLITCVGMAQSPSEVEDCLDTYPAPDNLVDSVLALDAATGAIKWVHRALPYDPWTVACLIDVTHPNCPTAAGPDFDFGQGPSLFTVMMRGRPTELLGAGQKSGQYWALDPDDGSVAWVTQAGPGSALGGLEWGSATDGKRVYVANTLTGWHALDGATGQILWITGSYATTGVWAMTYGAVSVANGVLFGGSAHQQPDEDTMYVLDAATGAVLNAFASGGSVGGSPAIVDGTVYWGSGYGVLGPDLGSGNGQLYAIGLP